jgi:hypothetical protein
MSRTFDPSDSWIPAGLRKPVKEALESGWTPGPDRLKRGGWFIYSPKRSEKFYIPITCKDPDTVAKKLRALISKAYLSEKNAFEPDLARVPGAIDHLVRLSDEAVLDGAVIIPGPTPIIRCPDCDDEFTGWEAFAVHQGPCQENVAAALEAKQEKQVPEEGGDAAVPSEGVTESVADSTEPVHSGRIGTKEETPLATEKNAASPQPTHNPETGRKRGYTWTRVNGKEDPLHEVLYEAVRYTRRFKNETDSKYTLRLAQYIETEGLLDRLVFADPDMQATALLEQIRELLGEGVTPGPSEEEIEQFKKDIEKKDEEIAALTKKVDEMSEFFSTMSEMGKEFKK